ncbi:MAG: hypothetical protein KA160_01610 [Lacibacter sp.]|nr:hypothetical protein [Lacibacter sp.]
MKQRIVWVLFISAFTCSYINAQSLYSRQAFASGTPESHQIVKRTYYSTTGEVVGPFDRNYRITGSGNTVNAFTAFGSTSEKLVLLIAQKDWLDLTNRIVVSGTGVTLSRIISKGVDGRGLSTQKSWIYFELTISPAAAAGNRTVRLIRPSLLGTDESTFTLNLQQNARILFQSLFTAGGRAVTAGTAEQIGTEIRVTFEGHRLHLVKGVRNNGNNITNSVLRNLRIVERSSSKLVFAFNIALEGVLTYRDFAIRYLDMEPGSILFNLNCDGINLCNFIQTRATSSGGLNKGVHFVYGTDAERGIN